MTDAENMTKYTTLAIYLAPLLFSIPIFLWLLTPVFTPLTVLNISLPTWYITTAFAYLTIMWIIEIGWSMVSVHADGGAVKNMTFGVVLFGIMAAITGIFTVMIFLQWYTFTNPTYNVILLILEGLGIALFLWQARTIISASVRSNHLFAIAGNG